MDKDNLIIGIDLGTTNSCAAVYQNGTIRILDNNEGDRITPSYLFLAKVNSVIVGKFAKRMADAKPEYGVYEIKRLIGRKFDDCKVKENLEYLSYTVKDVADKNEPVVIIKQPNDLIIKKTPEELCTAILSKIKTDVEIKLGEGQGQKAVITVPAYFNVSQREATLKAATKAGFTVLKLLNEPTAAALRFSLENEGLANGYFLVYDLGGGTFDVAIVKRTSDNVEIVGVDGDSHLGGHDFDNLILDFVSGILKEKHEIDAKSDKRLLRRLRNECEKAKEVLSYLDTTEITLEGFISTENQIGIEITRQQFEQMSDHLFKKTVGIVGSCLKSCNLAQTEIKKVILAGGSTRIPKIQEMLTNYFDADRVNRFLHPDECVAEGAAIQAAMFSTNPKQKIDVIKISDVTPLSLGIRTIFDSMMFFIKRNTRIPASIIQQTTTSQNQQESLLYKIYEGERTNVSKNRCLGEIEINNLTPAPIKQCAVVVTMDIDLNGILTFTAKEKYKNNIKKLKIEYSRCNRSDAEVKNTLKDAEENREEDERFTKFVELKKDLFFYCEAVKYNIENKNLMITHGEIYDLCSKTTYDKLEETDEAKVKELLNLVKSKCQFLVEQYNFECMPAELKHSAQTEFIYCD